MYRQFCKQVFDHTEEQFLDHNPAEDEESAIYFTKFFEQTQALYKKEFGEYIFQIRGRFMLRKILERIGDKLTTQFPRLASYLETN